MPATASAIQAGMLHLYDTSKAGAWVLPGRSHSATRLSCVGWHTLRRQSICVACVPMLECNATERGVIRARDREEIHPTWLHHISHLMPVVCADAPALTPLLNCTMRLGPTIQRRSLTIWLRSQVSPLAAPSSKLAAVPEKQPYL